MSDYSDQEIDLRPYVEKLLSKWYWIVGAAIAAAVLGLLLSSLREPSYVATALVAITEPRQIVQFDPRIQTVNEGQPLSAYPELALSDELLGEMLDQLPDDYQLSLADLRKVLSTESGADPSILRLSASNKDPVKAADLANAWAELFVSWANQIYGNQGDDQLHFFESQLQNAAKDLEQAEEALIIFQAGNRSNILDNELLALQQTQSDYLAKQRQIDLVLQDIDSLLAHTDDDGVQQLASDLLQIRALGGVANSAESTMPWQIQLNVDSQTIISEADQRETLSNLHQALLMQSEELEQRLAELEPMILSVQQNNEEANVEENRLGRELEVAEETYTTLARTVDEKRITSQDTTSGVKLASKTAVPENPAGFGRLLIMIGAGLLGALAAAVAITLITWWRGT